MQDLTTPPATSSPFAPAGANNMPGNTAPTGPTLGTPVPGTTGGLAAKPGLSVFNNPLASQLQSGGQQTNQAPQQPQAPQQSAMQTQQYGRGNDSMLVHMTPDEVNTLRGLAQQFGGDLTQNPHTGLPEAGFLDSILPILGGALLSFIPGVGPLMAAGITGAGTAAVTGDLSKGLMAGLGAFGGASLGGALAGGSAASTLGGASANIPGTTIGASAPIAGASNAVNSALAAGPISIPGGTITSAISQPSFLQRFGAAAAIPGVSSGITTGAAGLGLLQGLGGMNQPATAPTGQNAGPGYIYKPTPNVPRTVAFPTISPAISHDSSEFQYFSPVNNLVGSVYPTHATSTMDPNYMPGMGPGYAKGGKVPMEDGSFVMPARETAEFGNGSSRAGQEVLARMGGIPISGDGDGVSDSVPATIDGTRKARVARDEVHFPRQAVERLGNGDHKRGTEKLYSLMNKAQKARKRAGRGADTKLAKGLGALV